jgi:hypothetical protein
MTVQFKYGEVRSPEQWHLKKKTSISALTACRRLAPGLMDPN